MSAEIQFLELSLRNFLSFGNNTTEIDLTTKGTILVNGENLDTGGANGVGKTTIINAICYALYNNPFDKISLQRLINNTNNSKNTLMEVRLSFLKGGKNYEIYRCRGASTSIQILCEGEDITLDSVSENDKFIVELIGISYELFTNVIVFAGNSEPFLLKSVGDQRKLIEELFNVTILSEKAQKLKDRIKITEADINIQEAIVREQQNAIARHNKQVADAESRILKWEQDKEANIESIKGNLASIEGVDFESEQKNHELKSKISAEISAIKTTKAAVAKRLIDVKNSLDKTIKELGHLRDAQCPYCLQQYADANKKVEELEGLTQKLEAEAERLKQENDELENEIQALGQSLNEVLANIKYENLSSLLTISANSQVLRQKLEELQASTNPHLDAYESLLCESVTKVETKKLDELKSKLEHQQFLLKLLTDKNSFIRRRIINKTVPFLNDRLNYYSSELGLPHVVKFDDNMSCTVSEHGRELDFGNLSNGEKKRVNMAMSFAFRDVLHQLHTKLNLMFIDEVDGGALCVLGIDAIIKMIKRKSIEDSLDIWVISHRNEMANRFDREVVIRKENGFSQIEFVS